jgi:hypothetical protein
LKTINFLFAALRNSIWIGLSIYLFSCSQPAPSKIKFDGYAFELPINVKSAQLKLKLQYQCYSGFFNGNVNDKLISTQLADAPYFLGSDNDSEESYYEKNFVGVTFVRKNKTVEQFKFELEKQFHKKFETKTFYLGVTRTLPPFYMTYHFIQTDDGLLVALKEIEGKSKNEKSISISFYKGISEDELEEYLAFAH